MAGYAEGYNEEDFRTANIPAPVKVQTPPQTHQATNYGPVGAIYGGGAGGGQSTGVSTIYSGGGGPSAKSLAITDVTLRSITSVFFLITLALAASISDITYFTTTQYLLAIAIIALLYSLFQLVSAIIRLVQGKHMLPQQVSTWISYIGDEVVALFGFSAASSSVVYLTDGICTGSIDGGCSRLQGSVAAMFIGSFILLASLALSILNFYKQKW